MQLRSSRSSSALPAIEIAIEPRQPIRFEKNTNTRTGYHRGVHHVGVAGWSIRTEQSHLFDASGTHLQRYASRFDAVEINSSFYKPHRRATYERWAAAVPPHFRFSVKMPKVLTHQAGLQESGEPLARFVHEIGGLGRQLACILVQLPPGLAYDPRTVEPFFGRLRDYHRGAVVCEPRHPTWFTGDGDRRLAAHGVGRVAADPVCGPGADTPAGSLRAVYFRLHGSPVMYHSSYDALFLDRIARAVKTYTRVPVWCIFDNTARGAAVLNAMDLLARLARLAR